MQNTLFTFFITVVAPKKKAWYKLRETFGPEIFHEDDTLNREALGDIIFSNAEKRRLLNEITHPEIVKEMAWLIIKCFFRGIFIFIFCVNKTLFKHIIRNKNL